MGRSPPNFVGSRSPTARSSIFLSPLTVLIVVPFGKQFAFPFAQPFPTSLSFPQFAEAGFVFETLPRAANATIAPIFTRCGGYAASPRLNSPIPSSWCYPSKLARSKFVILFCSVCTCEINLHPFVPWGERAAFGPPFLLPMQSAQRSFADHHGDLIE